MMKISFSTILIPVTKYNCCLTLWVVRFIFPNQKLICGKVTLKNHFRNSGISRNPQVTENSKIKERLKDLISKDQFIVKSK